MKRCIVSYVMLILCIGVVGCESENKDLPLEIAYEKEGDDSTDIYLTNIKGTYHVNITSHSDDTNIPNYDGGTDERYPCWSPDGKWIVFSSYRVYTYSTAAGTYFWNTAVYVMDLNGENLRKLTPDGLSRTVPDWSPDGTAIAFSTHWRWSPIIDSDIFVINPNGSNLTKLHKGSNPSWSPDGQRIAFTWREAIYVMNADGSEPVNLTNLEAGDEFPSWSPDGSRIAFTSSKRDGNDEIYVMNADGSGPVNLTNHTASDKTPDWSPEGTRIVFASDRSGNDEIYIMNTDGSGLVSVGPGRNPAWSPVPPDSESGYWWSSSETSEFRSWIALRLSSTRRKLDNQ